MNGAEPYSHFPDAKRVSDWARDAMQWAVGNKIITGIQDGDTVYLSPDSGANRAQIATLKQRLDVKY